MLERDYRILTAMRPKEVVSMKKDCNFFVKFGWHGSYENVDESRYQGSNLLFEDRSQ